MPRILTRHVVTLTTLAAFRATTALHRATVQRVSMSSMDGVVPWRERITGSIARSRKIRGGNYVQLATVDASNAPHCRTVVFRGFAPDGRLKIITDNRSAKVKESRRVEVCWWFSQSSEQYRFAGDITYIGGDSDSNDDVALRKQQWGNLSDKAREQFFWAHPPAETFDAAPEAVPAGGRDADGKVLPAPDVFLLALVAPDAVDYLRLTDNFRQLDRLADGAWDCARVNP